MKEYWISKNRIYIVDRVANTYLGTHWTENTPLGLRTTWFTERDKWAKKLTKLECALRGLL